MRVAIYARVSTTRQAETDLSIPDQIAQVEAYCKRNGYVVVNTYVEPGASATDDKRPAFQQMMADAAINPTPFDVIIVHSYSRFFRDAFELELNVRKLAKRGIQLKAITQELSDDPMGQMVRQFLALFDEYQSKENGKHTKRAMKENARRGNHNGRPPYGYRLESTGEIGNKGRPKKRLAIEETEAAIVRRIYGLYLDGLGGKSMGMSAVAEYLNTRGMLRRGESWRIQTVSLALSNTVYKGEFVYNKRSGKDRRHNPEDEHICTAVPAIVDAATYGRVEARRRARRPAAAPARRLASPHLLSGLLKCGHCGAGMVVSTGTSKGGKTYAYYTCQTKLSRGAKACASRRHAIPKLEHLVLTAFAEQLLVPGRIQAILAELEKALAEGSGQEQHRLRELQKALKDKDAAYTRLVEAIEQGIVPLDEITRKRVQDHQTARTEVLAEIGRIRARQGPGIKSTSPKQVRAFTQAVRNRLLDRESSFAKSYLSTLVRDITVNIDEIIMRGDKTVLASAMAAGPSSYACGVRSSIPARDATLNAMIRGPAAEKDRIRRLVFRAIFLAFWVAFILYGTLFPFNFLPYDGMTHILRDFAKSLRSAPHISDLIINTLLFMPIGYLGAKCLRENRPAFAPVAVLTIFGFMLSLSVETAQTFLSMRTTSVTDLALNTLGTYLSAYLADSKYRSLSS